MALFKYTCKACGTPKQSICEPEQVNSPPPCKKCGGELTRTPSPPTTSSYEVLDNGLMSKRIERFTDAERLYKERKKPGSL